MDGPIARFVAAPFAFAAFALAAAWWRVGSAFAAHVPTAGADPLEDEFPRGGMSDEFRNGVAFAELCYRQAEADWAEALPLRGVDPVAALDRLAAAVDALAAERDALRDRIERAVAELDRAPDADPEKPGKRAMRDVLRANTFAWHVLAEGRDPPSRQSKGFPDHFPFSKTPVSAPCSASDDAGDAP